MLKALIWDVDGTIAETERDGHRVAFNQAFAEHGLSWNWDVALYGRLLDVTGGYERLMAFMQQQIDLHRNLPEQIEEQDVWARTLHRRKNHIYATLVRSGAIAARPGVLRVMDECTANGIALAIATTTSRANVEALMTSLLGVTWERRFSAVVCAEDAPLKKPDPLAYQLALERLGVSAKHVLAIEDSPNGLRAAQALGIFTLITHSEYFRDQKFIGSVAECDDLDSPVLWTKGSALRTDVSILKKMHAASARK